MSTTYSYVVLRLAVEKIRGEVINVGIALFNEQQQPQSIIMATLNKLRAIDATWDTARLNAWRTNIDTILKRYDGPRSAIDALGRFGFCEPDAVGMFHADTQDDLKQQLTTIKRTYISNKTTEDKPVREKRTRLQTLMRDQFKRMQIFGNEAGDVQNHLVVANLPVPGYDEFKNDFVYKNGVYRLTQTIDYNVSADSVHNKLMEACLKSTAAELAANAYGPGTMRMAVLDIPEALRDVTDHHIDMLVAKGFEVFHFGDASSMGNYMQKVIPSGHAVA